jgi:hypothetical protein
MKLTDARQIVTNQASVPEGSWGRATEALRARLTLGNIHSA